MGVEIVDVGGDSRIALKNAWISYPFPFGSSWNSVHAAIRYCIPATANISSPQQLLLGFCEGSDPIAAAAQQGFSIGSGFTYNGVDVLTANGSVISGGGSWVSNSPSVTGVSACAYAGVSRYNSNSGRLIIVSSPALIEGARFNLTPQQVIDALEGMQGDVSIRVYLEGITGQLGNYKSIRMTQPNPATYDHFFVAWGPDPDAPLQVSDIVFARQY